MPSPIVATAVARWRPTTASSHRKAGNQRSEEADSGSYPRGSSHSRSNLSLYPYKHKNPHKTVRYSKPQERKLRYDSNPSHSNPNHSNPNHSNPGWWLLSP